MLKIPPSESTSHSPEAELAPAECEWGVMSADVTMAVKQ